jgi:Tol biopolymer transport system component/predicted Ser/Thr protein kinase
MPLSVGTRLGPYEIISALGAGGMGEVYKARDTRLDRSVAVKILPPALAADPQFRERFDREARAISHLTHTNICTLYDVGDHDGTAFLVMELLEGQTLGERLESGPLPPAQALTTAIEIASALAAAHRAGIVHRDLKPGNVILTKAGAKLLDFGLAKTNAPVVAVSVTSAPTTPPGITIQGTILGTFQYMAPEQIEGLEADARTDIFAFGCVLFEMLTGKKAFEGKTPASLLGAILKDEPPRVSTVQPVTPPSLDRIVATCLAKDPDDRYQSARDLVRDLQWIAADAAAPAKVTATPDRRPVRARLAWTPAAVGGIALVASSIVAVRHLRETPAAADPVQFVIAPPEDATFETPPTAGGGLAPQVAVSPDGRHLVFVAKFRNDYQLWLRPLGAVGASVIPGTGDASFPFWSPDSRYVGFFANGKLKRVLVAGGPPVVVCDAIGRGGTWNRDNVIVFSGSDTILHRVQAAGGVPQAASAHDKGDDEASQHRFPFFLPDGRHFVYTEIFGAAGPASKTGRIRLGALDTMDTTTLLEADSSVAFASGHLLFNRAGTLMAQRFDAATRQLTSDAFPIVERIAYEGSRYASFSASDTGVLVSASGAPRPTTHLVWMDRAGRELGTVGDPEIYLNLALSSDERRVAVAFASGTPENLDIWILDAQRGTTRFTFDPGLDAGPIWSPDDLNILFQASRQGFPQMRQKRVDGTTDDEPLLLASGAGGATFPTDWSADGRYVAYVHRAPGIAASGDLWALPLFGDRKSFPLVETPSTELGAVISPDGRWFAYQSNEGGQSQIYARAFPPSGATFQVSKNGGSQPMWRRDGKALFFLSPDSKMMSAAVDTTGQFQAGIITPLFAVTTAANTSPGGRQYAVTKDGRFLVNVVQSATPLPLTVVVNWLAATQK